MTPVRPPHPSLLPAPVDQLTVAKGVVSVKSNPSQSVTYGTLVGDKPFRLAFTGTAPVKAPAKAGDLDELGVPTK